MLALSVWSRGWILSFWFLTGTVCAQNNETAKSNMPIKNFHLKNRLCKQNTLKAVLYGIFFLLTEYWTNSILYSILTLKCLNLRNWVFFFLFMTIFYVFTYVWKECLSWVKFWNYHPVNVSYLKPSRLMGFFKLHVLFCSCWSCSWYTTKISPTCNFNNRNLLDIFNITYSVWEEEKKKFPMTIFCLLQVGFHGQENVCCNFQIRKFRKSSFKLSC